MRLKRFAFRTILFAAVMAANRACTQKIEPAEPLSKWAIVSFESSAASSKVTRDQDTGKSSWTAGDKIRIYWGVGQKDNATATAQSSGPVTTFVTDTKIPTNSGAYWAIYPSTQNASLVAGTLVPDFAQAGRFATFDNVAVATASTPVAGGALNFSNACALLGFSTARTDVREARLSADGAIGGGSGTQVSVLLGDGASYPYQAGTYYIPVAPVSVNRFTLRLKTNTGQDLPAYQNSSPRSFVPSRIYTVQNLDDKIAMPSDVGRCTFRVMSLNILLQSAYGDGEHSWEVRKAGCLAMLEADSPDILCLQECSSLQRDDILNAFPEYARVGVSVRGQAYTPYLNVSSNPIFYKSSLFALEDWGTVWLSDTPDQVSLTWYYDKRRTATWARLRVKGTDSRVFMICTHLQDNKSSINEAFAGEETTYGPLCREKQVEVILSTMAGKNIPAYPVLMCGDLNSSATADCLKKLRAKLSLASDTAQTTDKGRTLNAFGTTSTSAIDHIFHGKTFSVSTFVVDRNAYAGVTYLSDHYPVYADLTLNESHFSSSLGNWTIDTL